MAARIIFALLPPSGQSTSKTFGFLGRFARQISPETNAHASMALGSLLHAKKDTSLKFLLEKCPYSTKYELELTRF